MVIYKNSYVMLHSRPNYL